MSVAPSRMPVIPMRFDPTNGCIHVEKNAAEFVTLVQCENRWHLAGDEKNSYSLVDAVMVALGEEEGES